MWPSVRACGYSSLEVKAADGVRLDFTYLSRSGKQIPTTSTGFCENHTSCSSTQAPAASSSRASFPPQPKSQPRCLDKNNRNEFSLDKYFYFSTPPSGADTGQAKHQPPHLPYQRALNWRFQQVSCQSQLYVYVPPATKLFQGECRVGVFWGCIHRALTCAIITVSFLSCVLGRVATAR